ncbi:hypothetical protein [Xanthomonas sp. SHU 199]|uniref:hypothetical protein n=1 Tax=Xanthomonas sp. SHU 199 TaxID=1591174 RepID=UPI0003753DBC|nr:hypothetical protein [Xanthomonas sp. SHU 199]
MSDEIKNLLQSARAAQGAIVATDSDGGVRYALPASTARGIGLDLAASVAPNVAALFDAEGRLRASPKGRPAVADFTLSALDIARAHSRCVAAGALLFVREEPLPPRRIGTGPELPVFAREVHGLSVVRPLPMAVVADSADAVVATALPVASASVDWTEQSSTPSYGATLEIPRNDYRDRLHNGTLEELLHAAILAGVGRIADKAVLAALGAASLANFSLANAASAGHQFSELRGIVGTTGAGAVVGADGVLRVAGVAAELTDSTTGTFIGDFSRSAIVLDREVRIVADRSSRESALKLSVFAGAAALVPDAQRNFWRVAA